MRTVRYPLGIAILLAGLAAFTSSDARKEYLTLRLETASGAPANVRVLTRGLILFEPRPSATGRQPWQIVATRPVPGEISLGGVGEADIELLDSTTTLNVEVRQVVRNPPPAQRLMGSKFRIARASYREPFRVMSLEGVASDGRARPTAPDR